MDKIKGILNNAKTRRNEEDAIDRWSAQYFPFIYFISVLLITTYTYMGKPMHCWVPAEFRKGWVEYTTDYCFIENTYWVPYNETEMPANLKDREEAKLPYYQWVQFVLLLLSIFFLVPHFIWRNMNWDSGVPVRAIVDGCAKLDQLSGAKREEQLDKITGHIYRSVLKAPEMRGYGGWEKYRYSENTVAFWYFVMKGLNIANIFFQLIILHIFLGYGMLDMLSLRLSFSSNWRNTGLFPRTTMCDFEVRNKGNVQRYTVQCVLSQNMFNEKVFLVLCWGLFILLLAAIINFWWWILRVTEKSREKFVDDLLTEARVISHTEHESHLRAKFTQINPTVAVLLHLLKVNAGEAVCAEVTGKLYLMFIKSE